MSHPDQFAEELRWLDATDTSLLIQSGEVSVTEVIEGALKRIQQLNPALNAVVLHFVEQARARARFLQDNPSGGPFSGVPFLLKDLGVAVAGQPLFLGNQALKKANFCPSWTSELALRFNRLGLVTLGTTNTPEMGAQTTTQSLVWGPARNPWDLSRSTSGSSGGAAAAVAAGMVPLAHGNDYLGSIRLPAAWNSVVGMIATRGLVPVGTGTTSRMSREFVIGRSVRDLAAVLDGVAGEAAGELWLAPRQGISYLEAIEAQESPLRIGLLLHSPHRTPVDNEVQAAVQQVGHALEDIGHLVELAHPDALFEDQERSLHYDRSSDYRRRIYVIERLLGRQVQREDVEPFLWEMAQKGGETVDQYLAAQSWQQEWSARLLGWWNHKGYDLLVCPTIANGPEHLADLEVSNPLRFFADHIARHVAFTMPWNVSGQPALALPWCVKERYTAAPPPSVQLIANRCRDDLVLSIAAQLEAYNHSVLHPSRV